MVHVLLKINSNFCILFMLHAIKGLVDSLTRMKVVTTGNWAKMDCMIPNTFYKM